MTSDTTSLVTEARRLLADGVPASTMLPSEVAARRLVVGLADRVVELEAERDDDARWSRGWRDLARRKEARVAALEAALGDVLGKFTQEGHPGRPCVRTHWMTVEWVARHRALLDGVTDTEEDDRG